MENHKLIGLTHHNKPIYMTEFCQYACIHKIKLDRIFINSRSFYVYNNDDILVYVLKLLVDTFGYILIPHGMLLNSYILYISLSHYIDSIEYNQTIYHLISLK